MDDPEHNADDFARSVHRFSLLLIVFLLGLAFGALNIPPTPFLKDKLTSTVLFFQELALQKPTALQPRRSDQSGVTVFKPARAEDGLTLVQGILPGGPQVRLIDMQGREVHRWPIDFHAIWPDPQHIVPRDNIPKSSFNYHTQGFVALPDGSLIVTVSGKGTVKLDKCAKPVWSVDRMTHHAVTPAPDGGYWLPAHTPTPDVDAALLPPGRDHAWLMAAAKGKWNNYDNTVLKIDAQGRVVKEFSVLQALFDARIEDALYDAFVASAEDPTHLNDIEIVTPALAARLDGVAAGDLLISLRNVHMLAILDQTTGALIWSRRGPWVRQHDPDILPDGTLLLYNNRSPLSGAHVTGSQILHVEPETGTTRVVHPQGREDHFASEIMGTQQVLPGGTMLITESVAGRVMEVTPDGEVVWAVVIPYDDEDASLISDAVRVPADFFNTTDWSCPN